MSCPFSNSLFKQNGQQTDLNGFPVPCYNPDAMIALAEAGLPAVSCARGIVANGPAGSAFAPFGGGAVASGPSGSGFVLNSNTTSFPGFPGSSCSSCRSGSPVV